MIGRNVFRSVLAPFIVRLTVGLLFVFAGLAKAFDARSFMVTLLQLDLFPTEVILPIAIVVIGCELCFGIALLIDFRTRIVAALLATLLFSFMVAISVAIARGKAVDCGCFGSVASERLGFDTILRDFFLIVCCLWLTIRSDGDAKKS